MFSLLTPRRLAASCRIAARPIRSRFIERANEPRAILDGVAHGRPSKVILLDDIRRTDAQTSPHRLWWTSAE
jgi:hypothetical protein